MLRDPAEPARNGDAWFRVSNRAIDLLRARKITKTDLAILNTILRYANGPTRAEAPNESRVSVAGAADCVGCHKRTARKSYATLAKFKLIEDTGRRTPKGARIWAVTNLREVVDPFADWTDEDVENFHRKAATA